MPITIIAPMAIAKYLLLHSLFFWRSCVAWPPRGRILDRVSMVLFFPGRDIKKNKEKKKKKKKVRSSL